MIDLHLHLDGSLDKEDFIYLANRQNIQLPIDLENKIHVSQDCRSLEEYLMCFDLPLSLLQEKWAIAYAVEALINRLYQKGYIYVEIRFAPLLHTQKGLKQSDVVEAAVGGLKKALKNKVDFDANLILCAMRGEDEKNNMETMRVASLFKNEKVVAVDLAGAEALHPATYFNRVFEIAREDKLNITIHAGEATTSDEVVRAIQIGAQRIGHGVKYDLSEENVKLVKEHHIGFEFCPTSNLQTTSLPSYESNPVLRFLKNDILVSINSDNMTVSNTDVFEEFSHLYRHLNLSRDDIHRLLNNAAEMAFVSDDEKRRIISQINAKFDDFIENITK